MGGPPPAGPGTASSTIPVRALPAPGQARPRSSAPLAAARRGPGPLFSLESRQWRRSARAHRDSETRCQLVPARSRARRRRPGPGPARGPASGTVTASGTMLAVATDRRLIGISDSAAASSRVTKWIRRLQGQAPQCNPIGLIFRYLQALPQGALPFKISHPQSSTLQVGEKPTLLK
jgi:hypothetical protein